MFADSVDEIESIQAGHIGAIVGLKALDPVTLCRVGSLTHLGRWNPQVFTASVEVGNS